MKIKTSHMTPKELLSKANEAMNAKDLLLASQLFTKILNKFPNHSAAKKGLQKLKKLTTNDAQGVHNASLEEAINELQKGNYQNAINLSIKFKLTNPDNPVVYNLIGICYVNQQNPKEGVPYFRTALRLNKQYPEAKANLGSALLMMGKIDDAILQLEESLKENPKNPMGWNSLGNALSQNTQLKQAQTAFERAIELAPQYLNAINSLGVLLNNMEERVKAIKIFEKGLKIDPNDKDILTNLGYTLADNGNIAEAIKVLSKVISLGQYNLDVKHRLGVLKSNSGQIKDAIITLREVVKEDPTLSEAYRSLSLIHKFEKSDPLISKMQNRLYHPDSTSYDKIHLGFALGKSLHDIKEYSKAFKAYKIANDTRRLELQYDITEHRNSIQQIKSIYSNLKINLKYEGKLNPIFILGMNRSGTTLVEQILSSHSDVHGAGELAFINKVGLQNLQNKEIWNIRSLEKTREEYINILNSQRLNKSFVTDKLPINFKWIGLIKLLFPEARIIHLIRNPVDTCLSNYRNYFIASGNSYAYNLDELANFFIDYRNVMEFWHEIFPGQIYACNYDLLTFNQEKETRSLIKYCGLRWQNDLLNFEQNKRSVKTASVGQVREGLYQTSVGGWEKYKEELKPLYEILNDSGCLKEWDQTNFA